MTKEELLDALRKLSGKRRGSDPEQDHAAADALLIEFIDDPDVAIAYTAVDKWYA